MPNRVSPQSKNVTSRPGCAAVRSRAAFAGATQPPDTLIQASENDPTQTAAAESATADTDATAAVCGALATGR